ncbi:Rieske domain-containing protein [Nostoc sp. DSM 114161]|jgi:nitrite reductase (NADH) small subunit|uniref:Rieske 2Fe-2S domain-containing protein n=1 Tax=Nostoc sp. DSM 114161 TaxID=3440143 RepID=UPI0040464986
MPVIKFDPQQSNFLIHGDRRFFLISLDNRTFLVTDNCPHRGGPLHLGYFNCQKSAIVCPWHNSAVSVQRLQQHAMPLVWRHNLAIAVIPKAESTPIVFKHRHILVAPEIGCNEGQAESYRTCN